MLLTANRVSVLARRIHETLCLKRRARGGEFEFCYGN